MKTEDGIEGKLDEAIRANRRGEAKLILRSGGKILANREVQVEQRSHGFQFGTTWGASTLAFASGELEGRKLELAEARNARFLEVFNQATLPFYWANFERERGRPDTDRLMKAALWYKERGIALKGHPLCWHTLAAPWLLEMGEDEILQEQLGRIRRDVGDFAGVIDAWDVINEAVIMPVFDKYDNGLTRLCRKMGRVPLIKALFDEARSADPGARLLINDFDTSPAYDDLIEDCLGAGIAIDAIGQQSHMHQGYWGPEKTARVTERLERFGLPVHYTENTIVSGALMPPEIVDLNDYKVSSWPSTPEGEDRQAREVVLHYKSLFARPSVSSITWWDLSDGCWLGAPAGLLHEDHEPKPAFEALKNLIKGEWWMKKTTMRSDERGELRVAGFFGGYRVEAEGRVADFSIGPRGAEAVRIDL
jgi:GH35 family endo-1,4-beta-xylanase